jgi:hypothetical protein
MGRGVLLGGVRPPDRAALVVIGTFYNRPSRIPMLARALREQTRQPDICVLIGETAADAAALAKESWPGETLIAILPTPIENDRYLVLPYSRKINAALDLVSGCADLVTYVTDDSLPAREKYERMEREIYESGAGVVYCTQDRGGGNLMWASEIIRDAWCVVDHTQVMHRFSPRVRWPVLPEEADIRLGDAWFWRRLHAEFGSFYPVRSEEPLDIIVRDPGEPGITADGWTVR